VGESPAFTQTLAFEQDAELWDARRASSSIALGERPRPVARLSAANPAVHDWMLINALTGEDLSRPITSAAEPDLLGKGEKRKREAEDEDADPRTSKPRR
jgi:hypothetical protein